MASTKELKRCVPKDKSKLTCKNMKSTYDGWDGERYRCTVCGESIWLDYEDMK